MLIAYRSFSGTPDSIPTNYCPLGGNINHSMSFWSNYGSSDIVFWRRPWLHPLSKEAHRMEEAVRNHFVLGEIRWNAGLDSWEATVYLFPGCPVRFAIIAEAEWSDADPAELFEIGAAFLDWARGFEAKVRARVADELLEVYNRS